MKVSVIDFEEEVLKFLRDIVKTLPTTGHKFAAGAMIAASALRIEQALSAFADDDGCIDTEKVRALVNGGFESCGEKATFTVGGGGYEWLLKPVSISITEQDMASVIARLEARQRTG